MGESSAEQLFKEEVQNSSTPVGPCMNAVHREEQYSEVLLAPLLRLDQQELSRPDGPFVTVETIHDQHDPTTPEIPSVCIHTTQPTQLAYKEDGCAIPSARQPTH